ncbi:MAG: SLBB domain-containing protein, partial [Gammaproteobacteria bacterium]
TSMSEKFSKENTQEDSTNTIQQFRITDLKVLSFGEFAYVAPLTGDIVPEKLFNFFGRDQIIEENLVTASTTDGLIERALKMTIDSKLLSQINFPEQKSPKFFLQISGQVNNPGTFTANTDMTLEDAYNLAGGLTDRADKSAIIFQRQSIKEREFSALNNAKKTILDSVITQLSNPMNNSPSNIGDLLPVLDLVEDFEFLGRLTGELSPGSSSAKTINLEPGDKIFVPAISSSVTVLGEVLQPLSTSFQQNLTFKDYLEVAGNLSTYADKSNMYIIKPDGTSVPIRYSEISKYYLSPGDTIIVPRNLEKLNTLPLISTSVKIISDIAFAAASLNILRN